MKKTVYDILQECNLTVDLVHNKAMEARVIDAMKKYASQSPCVSMPGEEDLKQYITNLLYKARDNSAVVLSETLFDNWQNEQAEIFANAIRSQVQAIDGRELLIKFAEFLNENINEDEIDAFLRDNAT